MPIHKVTQGECLISIAQKYGFNKWEDIYEHPNNEQFKQQRTNPHCIYPGDKVYIPEKSDNKLVSGKEYKFKIPKQKFYFSTTLTDMDNNPLSSIKYKLEIRPQGKSHKKSISFEGQTDGSGKIEQEIPVMTEEGILTIWPFKDDQEQMETWVVKLGHLDPKDEIEGVQERLLNQGYASGPISHEFNKTVKSAANEFQETNNKESLDSISSDLENSLAKGETE